jgi:hypothetical protein
MVMYLNVAYISLRERDEYEGTKTKGEEEDQDVMCKISFIEFVEQIGKE